MQPDGEALGLAAGLREGEVDEQAEENDDDHVDGDPHGVAGADECGGDQGGGATEDGDDELVGEPDAGHADRGREQLGLNGRIHRLPDPQHDPAGCGDQHVDPESFLVQQQEQRVEQDDHADGADDREDLAAAESVGQGTAGGHDDDEQDEPDDTAGEGGGGVPAGGEAGVGGQEGGPGVVRHGRRGQRRGLQQSLGVFFEHGPQSRRRGLLVHDGTRLELGGLIGVDPQEQTHQTEDAADEERDAPAPVGQGFRVEHGGDDRGGTGRGQGRQAAGHVGEGTEQASAVRGGVFDHERDGALLFAAGRDALHDAGDDEQDRRQVPDGDESGGQGDDQRAERHPGDGQGQDDLSAVAVGQWRDDDSAEGADDKPDRIGE